VGGREGVGQGEGGESRAQAEVGQVQTWVAAPGLAACALP